ncbi:MAG: hypothetical protein LBV32_06150 [Tannerellaceae bacterium]|jgi:hypothetical protein|nr:hypothetical protein [Tannerellaceae bacterium]
MEDKVLKLLNWEEMVSISGGSAESVGYEVGHVVGTAFRYLLIVAGMYALRRPVI